MSRNQRVRIFYPRDVDCRRPLDALRRIGKVEFWIEGTRKGDEPSVPFLLEDYRSRCLIRTEAPCIEACASRHKAQVQFRNSLQTRWKERDFRGVVCPREPNATDVSQEPIGWNSGLEHNCEYFDMDGYRIVDAETPRRTEVGLIESCDGLPIRRGTEESSLYVVIDSLRSETEKRQWNGRRDYEKNEEQTENEIPDPPLSPRGQDPFCLKYSPSTALTASGTVSSLRAFLSPSSAFSISSEMDSITLCIIAIGINRHVSIPSHVYLLISEHDHRTSPLRNGCRPVRSVGNLPRTEKGDGARLGWEPSPSPSFWRFGP